MTDDLEILRDSTDSLEYNAGRDLYLRGGVHDAGQEVEELVYRVDGLAGQTVRVRLSEPPMAQCGCPLARGGTTCRHMVASLLQAHGSGLIAELTRRRAQDGAKDLLNAFEPALLQDAQLTMEITLHLALQGSKPQLHIALRLGQERMYVVRSLPQFLRALEAGETVTFGKGFVLEPRWMSFDRIDMQVLKILREIEAAQRPCEAQGYRAPQEGKFLPVPAPQAARLLRLLLARPFRMSYRGQMEENECVRRTDLPMRFLLRGLGKSLILEAELPADLQPLTEDCEFMRCGESIVQLARPQREMARSLLRHMRDGRSQFRFDDQDMERMISELLPRLELAGIVEIDNVIRRRMVRMPLKIQVYLDRDGTEILARTVFHYGETEIDPFKPANLEEVTDGTQPPLLMRDAAGERAVLDELAHAGFKVRSGRVYLSSARQVLAFLLEGVKKLQDVAEVFCSENFRRMRPRRPQLSGKLTMQQGSLLFEMYEDGTPLEELEGVLEALRDKHRYFRLKDGSFLQLDELFQWQELAESLSETLPDKVDHAETASSVLPLERFRAIYLSQMLENSSLPVELDGAVTAVADALGDEGAPCPKPLDSILRPYQIRGFSWLQALHRLKMGGVLADDMGLGKTLQVIAVLFWAKQALGCKRSLVVTPTSLVYNWQAEFQKFSPALNVCVIEGGQAVRQQQWQWLAQQDDVDVIITSYPLIRRDIELIRDIPLRFAVLDEAQQIKNALSMGATAVKQLQAETRLALTGTPMENHPGELWSIFDYVLPGYLLTQAQFMRHHGDGGQPEALRRRIRPFLLRRLKQDVLPDLPDKLEHVLLCDMPPEQRRAYSGSLLQLRQRMDNLLRTKGVQRGRIEVLAMITQLRQICCHPALCMEGYGGSSGKLDALLDILPGALEAGHRVLLFSQFTSMLQILQKKLEAEGVSCLYLDGKTPVQNRLTLVNRFNDGEGQIFLISLKAGGSGLNLTGADTVVHYDPWWNPAAEDQATDRAHRIGQVNRVQVIRLITRNSIEEQVARLGERKRMLFDAVVTAGEQMPTQLTEDDIRALFEDVE